MLELDERYANTSSIMPQKKNPGTLETVRARAASAVGGVVTTLAAMKSAAYTNIGDTREMIYDLTRMVGDAVQTTRIVAGAVSTMIVNREQMLRRAAEGFGTMTSLADAIVRNRGLPFRSAHEVVAELVVQALRKGLLATQLTPQMLDQAAIDVIGRKIDLSFEEFGNALDPIQNVAAVKTVGGPAPQEVTRMLQARNQSLVEGEARLKERS